MPMLKVVTLTALCLAGAGTLPLASAGPAVLMEAPDWSAIVGPYPLLGTQKAMEERAILLWLQGSRTASDIGRAQSGNTPSLGCFGGIVRRTFAADAYPRTTALLTRARQEVMPVVRDLKAQYGRPHPFEVLPGLDPVLPEVEGFSYPSTHAVLSVVYARILAQLDPLDRGAIDERGRLLGNDRVTGGAEWPSDVVAGQRLGKAFADWWIGQPEHRLLIQQACAEEWHTKP
jgi:acid phosphatase (class A)